MATIAGIGERPSIKRAPMLVFARSGARYVNLAGWFAWLLMVRLADRPRTNPKMVRLYDRTVILVQRRLEPRFAPPSGQSVFGVGVKD